MNHRMHIARDRYHKQQNAEIQEVVRNDPWCAEKACTQSTEPQCPAGYQVSQKKRKRIEEVFGWMKSIGLLRKVRHRGLKRVGWMFTFTAAAYNLVRIRNLVCSGPHLQCA